MFASDAPLISKETIKRAGFIHDSLFYWAPDGWFMRQLYKGLKRFRLVNDDNTSHRFVSLQWLICCINEYMLPNNEVEYVCNKRVSSGAYLHPLVSSDPLTFLLLTYVVYVVSLITILIVH